VVTFADRVKVNTTTTGTGTITLGAAASGYQTFADGGVTNGDEVRYVIEDGVYWEIGVGQYIHASTTLTRTLTSSSTGSLLNLSGSAEVFISPSSADLILSSNAYKSTEFNSTAGQTSYTLNYVVGSIDVFFNGVKLAASDYTASNGTSIVLADAAAVNDKVEVVEYGIFNSNLSTFGNNFTLPSSDGTNGQALITNGSGTLSFGTVSGGGGSASLDAITVIPSRTVTSNITVSSTQSAFSVGPITIQNGVTVTVQAGGRYVMI